MGEPTSSWKCYGNSIPNAGGQLAGRSGKWATLLADMYVNRVAAWEPIAASRRLAHLRGKRFAELTPAVAVDRR